MCQYQVINIIYLKNLRLIFKVTNFPKKTVDVFLSHVDVDLLFLQSKIVPWWPNGVGDPTLYTLHVTFKPDTTGEKVEKSLRVGFRTVKLVQNVLPQNAGGYSFR